MRLKDKVHSALADRVKWIQYPQIERVSYQEPKQHIDFASKVIIGVFSFVFLLIGLGLCVAGLFILYVIVF